MAFYQDRFQGLLICQVANNRNVELLSIARRSSSRSLLTPCWLNSPSIVLFQRLIGQPTDQSCYVRDFCGEGTPSGEFSTAVLFECLTRDTPDMIPTYFAVYEIVNDLARQVNSLGIWQIKFALELCSSQSGSPNGNVIQEEFLMAVRSHLHAYFSSPEFDAALSHYIGQSGSYPSTPMFGYSQSTTAVLFSMFLTFFDIPLHAKLSQCLDSLRQWPPGGNFLPKLSRMFPTVPVQGLVRIERAVKAMRLHAEQVA